MALRRSLIFLFFVIWIQVWFSNITKWNIDWVDIQLVAIVNLSLVWGSRPAMFLGLGIGFIEDVLCAGKFGLNPLLKVFVAYFPDLLREKLNFENFLIQIGLIVFLTLVTSGIRTLILESTQIDSPPWKDLGMGYLSACCYNALLMIPVNRLVVLIIPKPKS